METACSQISIAFSYFFFRVFCFNSKTFPFISFTELLIIWSWYSPFLPSSKHIWFSPFAVWVIRWPTEGFEDKKKMSRRWEQIAAVVYVSPKVERNLSDLSFDCEQRIFEIFPLDFCVCMFRWLCVARYQKHIRRLRRIIESSVVDRLLTNWYKQLNVEDDECFMADEIEISTVNG